MAKQTSIPHRGAWLVYVNGILLPTQSVNVTYGVGQIPEASFAIPPHKSMARIGNEDRLDVVIFYLDTLADPRKPEFRLLFEGEITGWSYTSMATGRMMQFDCLAHISIFKALIFSFINNVSAFVDNETSPSPETVSTPGVFYPYSLFSKGLLTNPATEAQATAQSVAPQVTTPFEILYNVVRGMIDINIKAEFRALPGVNFFARWCRKNNFQNRFVALPSFEDTDDVTVGVFPIFIAAQSALGIETMKHDLAKTIGEAGSIWDVLREVFGVVYEEIMMLPTAPCVRVNPSNGFIQGTLDSKTATGTPRLLNYAVKPQMFFGVPPKCNVIFPSILKTINYHESYSAQPTRVYVNESFLAGTVNQNAMTLAQLRTGYPKQVNAAAQQDPLLAKAQNLTVTTSTSLNAKNTLVWPEEFFKGPVSSNITLPKWFWLMANRQAQALKENNPGALTPLMDLLQGYSEYEYYRQRYAQRSASISTVFNPYIIPGFPCTIFDRRQQPIDLTGYVMAVSHSFSTGHMETNITTSFVRTLPEMLELLGAIVSKTTQNPVEAVGTKHDFISAPLEPVSTVSNIIQDAAAAETFYTNLLFGKAQLPLEETASFDFRKVVGYAPEEGSGEAVTLISTAGIADRVASGLPLEVAPLKTSQGLFEDHDTAMAYVSRPICTLLEYIAFIHGEETLNKLQNASPPRVGAVLDDFGPAIYFQRIKYFRPGPGDDPTPAQMNATPSGTETYTGAPAPLLPSFAQTRYDWDEILLAYSDEMLNRKSPQSG